MTDNFEIQKSPAKIGCIVNISLSEREFEKVTALAKKNKITRTKLLRDMIKFALERIRG